MKTVGGLLLYSFFFLSAAFAQVLHHQRIPQNVDLGVVPPFELIEEIVSSSSDLLVRTDATLRGAVLQTRNSFSEPWRDVSGAFVGGQLTDGTQKSQFFRVRHQSLSAVTLKAERRPNSPQTNIVISFGAFPGWNMLVQTQSLSDRVWRDAAVGSPAGGKTILPKTSGTEVRVLGKPPVVREDYQAILISGQSNAEFTEYPLPNRDTNALFLTRALSFAHPYAYSSILDEGAFAYSFAAGAAADLFAARGEKYLLIPTAVGGTAITQWLPRPNRFDRTTLFGEANFRRVLAAPKGVRAIWYYGHESSTIPPEVDNYLTLWKRLMAEHRAELGSVPIIYAQLAKSTEPRMHQQNFRGAELLRQLETGQPEGLPSHHMVVTFDLPLGDVIHLSGWAQRELGRRFALAMRQHVYGESVNGTGPRLEQVSFLRGNRQIVQVQFDREVAEPVNRCDNQFAVWSASHPLAIARVRRGLNSRSVQLELAETAGADVRVSYGDVPASRTGEYLPNVVRDLDGLPAPAFGPILLR